MLVFVQAVLVVFGVAIARYIQNSWIGRGLQALRDDELAAECTGVPTLRLKMTACVISGALMCAAGAPAAMYLQYADPSSAFNLSYSVSVLAMALIGGTAHWIGPVIGASVSITASSSRIENKTVRPCKVSAPQQQRKSSVERASGIYLLPASRQGREPTA